MEYIILHSHSGRRPIGVSWHFFVEKSGKIQYLVPVGEPARHCMGRNKSSISVCFEGCFDTCNELSDIQLENGKKLLRQLLRRYPECKISPHRAFLPVDCPGKWFPMHQLLDLNPDRKHIDKFKREDYTTFR